ncbi:MAG: hypothetical protein KBH11_12740 [Bacteroidia bacterium]|nr:hypothetical protein [Bacteroidia bacterium]
MRRVYNFFIVLTITILLFFLSLELAYRYQWIDFYQSELTALNTKEDLLSNKKKILICGDSFSADPSAYVKTLRESLTNYAVINCAVSGTGIRQHELYLNNRIGTHNPDIFIYQFYVGNDLFDITHPHNSKDISLLRRFYWWLSDRMLSLGFLNFKLAVMRYNFFDDSGGSYKPRVHEEFSVEKYSKREKLNYVADPYLLENTLFLKGQRKTDYETFEYKFDEIIKSLKDSTRKYLIIIPHQSQLSELYFNRHNKLGVLSSIPYYQYETEKIPLYQKLESYCKQNHITIIDPVKEFRHAETLEQIYFSNDPHLKENGQYVVAKLLIDEINKQ